VTHDSRTSCSLGTDEIEKPFVGNAWIEEDRARVITSCLAVLGYDGELHPQNRSPEYNRNEFRHVLFNEDVTKGYSVPFEKEISYILSRRQPMPDAKAGPLVQLSALAPIVAMSRDLTLEGKDFENLNRMVRVAGKSLPVFRITCPKLGEVEAWVDPEFRFRVRRMIARRDNHDLGQIDIYYHDDLPVAWTILEFASDGYVSDFIKAKVTNIYFPTEIPSEVFVLKNTANGQLRLPKTLPDDFGRDSLARVRSVWWVAIIAVALAGAVCFRLMPSRIVRLSCAVALTILLGIACAKCFPIADVPLRPVYDELSNIFSDLEHKEGLGMTDTGDSAYEQATLKRLAKLSNLLDNSHEIHREGGVWSLLCRLDSPETKVRYELLQLAKNDLVQSIKSPSQAKARSILIAERLSKIDRHLSGATAFSPYSTPISTDYTIDDPRLSRISSGKRSVMVYCVAALVLLGLPIVVLRYFQRGGKAGGQ